MKYKDVHVRIPQPDLHLSRGDLAGWLPTRGNILFTLLMIALLLWAQTAGALPLGRFALAPSAPSTSTIAYQGRLADASGNPLTQTVNMTFRLYNVAAGGGEGLWAEDWIGPNGVQVSDGLFNVMLGSLTPIPASLITSHSSLFLGITVGTDDEMAPRVQLGTVPFAVQALTVPDGSVTMEKIADGAVTQAKLGADVSLEPPDGSITEAKLNLTSDSICRGSYIEVQLPGNYTRVPIPGFELSLNLEIQSTILVWSNGHHNYQPVDGGHGGTSIHLDDTEISSAYRVPPNGGWVDFTMIKIVEVPAGTHTLDLRAHALGTGTARYTPNTCLQYIVLGS